jgi:hypothetical protein
VLTLWFAGTLMVVAFQDSETDATRSSSAFGCSSPHRARHPCDDHDAPTGRSGPGATPDDRPILRVVAVLTFVGTCLVLIAWRRPRRTTVGMTARSSDTS